MIPVDRPEGRARLRALLRARYPWLEAADVGPRAVVAGECDRCGHEARLAPCCGPVPWEAVGRQCAAALGFSGWCEGHTEEAVGWLAWLGALPEEADLVARLWWVATGEVRSEGSATHRRAVAALERGEALPSPEPGDANGLRDAPPTP